MSNWQYGKEHVPNFQTFLKAAVGANGAASERANPAVGVKQENQQGTRKRSQRSSSLQNQLVASVRYKTLGRPFSL